MARELKNHPGMFLNDAAAADFDKIEDMHGIFTVNSARREEAEQQELIDRWDEGGPANRPPWLYNPYRPARLAPHVKNGGIAVDIAQWARFQRVMADGHFTKPYDWDVVHFEHDGNTDTLNNERKDIFMALSDEEQAELLAGVREVRIRVRGDNPDADILQEIRERVTSIRDRVRGDDKNVDMLQNTFGQVQALRKELDEFSKLLNKVISEK